MKNGNKYCQKNYVFKFLSADRTFGSVTTRTLLNVEALPTEFVASQIYLPSSSSLTHVKVSEQILFQHFNCTCDPLLSISFPSLNHLISGKGSPFTFNYNTPLVIVFISYLIPYLAFQSYNALFQYFYLSRKYFYKLRNLMAFTYNNRIAHYRLAPSIPIPGRDSKLIFSPWFQIKSIKTGKGSDAKLNPS